jgi:raffinose/stachyose/melibiose transport system permease protein
MCILSSISVTGILLDFEKMPQAERFDFDNFWFPPITSDQLCAGPFRGVGGGGNILAVANKGEPVHEKNVVDFLMYLTTPESGRILIERTLDDEQALVGPLLIKDVKLPKDLHDKFSVFMGHGFEKLNFRGLEDEQESAGEWVVAAQEYFAGRTSLEEFLNRYQEIMLNAIPRLQKRDGLDLDPRTKDIPPKVSCRKNKLNPFENGSLMLLIIILLFSVLALWHISRSKGIARSHTKMAYLLLLPTFMLLATFNYVPALSGLYHAFTDWEEGRKAVFCGFDNFVKLASDKVFFRGLWNISILLVTALLKNTLVPFLAAELILALVSSRLRYIFRTAFLIPMVVPAMVIILIWRFVYDPNMGMLNQALAAIGLERFCLSWLGEPNLALGAIVFMGFPWIGALGLLIYMAGLMRIPSSVIEAYRIESSSIFRRVWNIDIPLVRGQTRLLIILTFIGTIQDFQTILIMTRGGPGLATYVPALRMYYQAFTYSHFGYGAAIGFVLFAAILILTLFTQKLVKPTVEF